MKIPLQVLKSMDGEIIYSLPGGVDLAEKFFAGLDWSENIKTVKFFLSSPCEDEFKLVAAFARRFHARVVYSANRNSLRAHGQFQAEKIEIAGPKSQEEIKTIFFETNDAYREDIGKPLTQKERREREDAATKLLTDSRVLCLQKNGQLISALFVFKWKDCFGAPVDWIPWVWTKSDISASERFGVHQEQIVWLREHITDRVQCIVAADNLRSRKFFVKIGFNPECIVISKDK